MPKLKQKPLPTVPNRYLTIDGPYSRRRVSDPKVWPVAIVAVLVSVLIAVHAFESLG